MSCIIIVDYDKNNTKNLSYSEAVRKGNEQLNVLSTHLYHEYSRHKIKQQQYRKK